MNDHQRDDLHFAHRALAAATDKARAAEHFAEAEEALYAALDRRMFRAIATDRFKSAAAVEKYGRIHVLPQFRRSEAARVAAARATDERWQAAAAYDKALNRAAGKDHQ